MNLGLKIRIIRQLEGHCAQNIKETKKEKTAAKKKKPENFRLYI
jgi:hypothetical protein